MKNKHFTAVFVGCGLLMTVATGAMAAGEENHPTVDPTQLQALQGRMLSNPQIMTIILSLQNDPEMQALLGDPAVAAAVLAGNFNTLVNDPRFVKLLGKPQVKEVERQLRQE